ncbi:MAG TPA: carboxypeptidase-like regulatory domain-containing protein, partial [Aquaticitalea sp.]|nr:carboxypeptidase-like regulatory domain-containing protein [Aquaticitalea sp.]
MLRKLLTYSTILLAIAQAISQTVIKDETTKQPVSFATISFGNGNGVFADDEGSFIFTEKLYPDIDTLYISALGYKDLVVPSVNLGPTLYMKTQIDHLNEVVIR